MMRLFILGTLLLLTGCNAKPIELAYNCPIINLPPDPVWQTALLNAKSSNSTVIKAWPADLGACRALDTAVRTLIQKVNEASQAGGY